jgi:hypothetical protein
MSEFGHRLEFDADGQATCNESGQLYQLTTNQAGEQAVEKTPA